MGDMFSLTSWKDGPKKINPLKQVFLLFIIFASVQPIFAHSEIEDINSTHPVLIENQNPSSSQEDILREAQRSVDRSISILGIVATSMGVLVGLLTIVIIVAIALGVFEYSRWKSVREDIEKRATESEDKIKQVEEDAKIIRDFRRKLEEDVDRSGEELKNKIPPLTEKPPKEIEEKLDEFSRKFELLEMLGASLKPEDYYNRGLDLYYKEKYELALTAFEKAIELKPDFANAWGNIGIALGELGRPKESLMAYEKAIELKPDFANAWDNKGVALGELGRLKESLAAHEKAIELKPDHANAWYNKGVALGELGRPKESLMAYEKAIELKPDHAIAWGNKGVALGELGRLKESLAAHEKAIELKPDHANAWDNKGVALGELGRHEDALTAHEKAIELESDVARAWDNKGAALNKLGRHEDALVAHEKAIELKPDYASAWFNKACIYSLKGDKKNTLTNLSKAIDLDAKLKEKAKKDEDFKKLWDDPDFKKIVSNQK